MPRRLQASGKDAPTTVESRLDDFISRANEELVDVADFDPSKATAREQALREEVVHLKQRLEAFKSKRRPSQGWGKLVIGFVLGCGAMFAVSALMPRDEAPPASTAQPAPVAAPAPVVAPPPAKVEVTPIEEAPAPVAAPASVETPAPPPVEPAAVDAAAPKPKKVRRPKPSQQPAPPAGQAAGSDSSLYNPF